MNLIKALEKYKKKRLPFRYCDDYSFYSKNKMILDKFNKFSYLAFPDNEFDIIRANILIHGYKNKSIIEREIISLNEYQKEKEITHQDFINTIKERIVDLPYFTYKNTKIFVPFFSFGINILYTLEPEKLLKHPYDFLLANFEESLIDPFDTYGFIIFDSLYSKLIKIGEKENVAAAYFHYDTNTIYIVNYQGRLDCKIVLFDKYLKRPNYNHMLDRLRPVANAYLNNDKKLFVKELIKNGFVSEKLLAKIKYHEEDN